MRLSAPLHTNLHPINRHTAGAAGKLIFLFFFPLASLLPLPPAYPRLGAARGASDERRLRPLARWGAGWGFVELSPCVVAALGCSSRATPQSWRFGPISRGPALSIGLSIPLEDRRGVVSPLLRGDKELPLGALATGLWI